MLQKEKDILARWFFSKCELDLSRRQAHDLGKRCRREGQGEYLSVDLQAGTGQKGQEAKRQLQIKV